MSSNWSPNSPIQNNIENFYYEHLDEEYLSDSHKFLGPFFSKREHVERFVTTICSYISKRQSSSIAESVDLIVTRLTQQDKTNSLFTKDTLTVLAWIIVIRDLILKDKIPLSSNTFLNKFPEISHQSKVTADELLNVMRFERALKYFRIAKIDFRKSKDLILRVCQYFEWSEAAFRAYKQNPPVVDAVRSHIYNCYSEGTQLNHSNSMFPSPKSVSSLPTISSLNLPPPHGLPTIGGQIYAPKSSLSSFSVTNSYPLSPAKIQANSRSINWRNGNRYDLISHFNEYLDQLNSLQEIDEFSERLYDICWK